MDDPSMACSCHQNGGKKIHNYFVLETMLPVEYSYLICFCNFNKSNNHLITSRFHLNCFTKDEALEWIEKCSSITKLTFIIEKKGNTIYARCSCMLTENECTTVMKIYLNPSNVTSSGSSMKQSILHEHPTTVILQYTHDFGAIPDMLIEEIAVDDFHDSNDDSMGNQTATKTKPTFPESIMHRKLSYLFDKGKSPQRTYELFKNEIHSVFNIYNTDGTQQPDMEWVEKQFYIYFENKHGIQFTEALTRWRNQSREQSAKPESTVKEFNVLDSKIDELCKKYKPILPARESRNMKSEPDISISSTSPQKVIDSLETSMVKNTPSYVIKFNSEPKPEKLNLIPVKLIPNDIVVQNRLPDLTIVSNTNDNNHHFKMIGINDSSPPNIAIPPLVHGVFILTNNVQPQLSFKQSNTDTRPQPSSKKSDTDVSSLKASSSGRKPPSSLPTILRIHKHPRKSRLKCEDSDDMIFTDRVEDLQLQAKSTFKKGKCKSPNSTSKEKKVVSPSLRTTRKSRLKCEDPDDIIFIDRAEDLQLQVKSTPRKRKRKSRNSMSKKKKVVPPSIPTISKIRKHPRKSRLKWEDPDDIIFTDRVEDLQLQMKSTPKKSKRESSNFTSKKKKVVLESPAIVDGIENVICSD